MKLFAYEELY